MQQGPRVAVIGLDCATPTLLFDDLRAEVPTIAKLMDRRDVRRPRQHHASHHGPGLGVRDDGSDAGAARDLRVPEPQGHQLRRLSIAHAGSVKEPAVWDALGAKGMSSVLIGVPPRIPPPADSPGGASDASSHRRPPTGTRSRRISRPRSKRSSGGRPVHLRHPELPDGWLDCHARPGVQDDRASVPGGAQADPEQAVGPLHALRHRAGPLHHVFWQYVDPTHPLYEPGNKYEPSSRTTTGSWTGARVVARVDPGGRGARSS
jgi:hypothetical protein